MKKHLRALILGCPGAGKGTQTKRILKKHPEIIAFSSGDILRSHVQNSTAIGLKIKNLMEHGHLVSDEIITPIMLERVEALHGEDWLLDGFPRTRDQAIVLDEHMAAISNPINFVINLDVPWNVILDRIENRWIHAPSGRTYNLSFNPPKKHGTDDITGEPLTKRADDDPEAFKVRLEEYAKATMPLIDYYQSRGVLFNFKGDTSDEITPQLIQALDKHFDV